jgi:rubredoxin
MSVEEVIKINFRGGIIPPGDLYNILVAATKAYCRSIRFGLRQQLFIPVEKQHAHDLCAELDKLGIEYELNSDEFPGIVSSYPAEEVFITNTWLSEGIYKDIFDGFDHKPRLKINISDSDQSFTPMLTGNINWIASKTALHFWHLFIRFPKTNTVFEWDLLAYTNDLPKISKEIEKIIFDPPEEFYDNPLATGNALFNMLNTAAFITKKAEKPAVLPLFNLPYYEGLNRYNNKYWLGIYRRDELFSIDFLKELCLLCLETKLGQICSTPWKSIIVKGIEEKDKSQWNRLLEVHQINMRHAANELNFQVEDNCGAALKLKQYLVKQLNNEDTRSFGICIGIKTKSKTEVFSSILIKRKALISVFGIRMLYVYDILCALGFNPNERTGYIFSSNNPRFLLGEQLRRAILEFYKTKSTERFISPKNNRAPAEPEKAKEIVQLFQCKHCFTVYDETVGDMENAVEPGTSFNALPGSYCCSLCESPKTDFVLVEKQRPELV